MTTERTFAVGAIDPELAAIEIITTVEPELGGGNLSDAQRWRIVDYVGARFGRPPQFVYVPDG